MEALDPDHQHTTPFTVRPLSPGALPHTAALHEELLPNGLFPALGQRFLRRWHRTFITSPYAIGLSAHGEDGRCCGFLIGTTDQGRYIEDVLSRDRYHLAAIGALALMTRPRLVARFARTRAVRYVVRITTARKGPRPDNLTRRPEASVAVLHAVITEPATRGCGIGAALMGQFESELRCSGSCTLQLVTLASGDAAGFYTRLGFAETDRRTNRDGEVVIQFERQLKETT